MHFNSEHLKERDEGEAKMKEKLQSVENYVAEFHPFCIVAVDGIRFHCAIIANPFRAFHRLRPLPMIITS